MQVCSNEVVVCALLAKPWIDRMKLKIIGGRTNEDSCNLCQIFQQQPNRTVY